MFLSGKGFGDFCPLLLAFFILFFFSLTVLLSFLFNLEESCFSLFFLVKLPFVFEFDGLVIKMGKMLINKMVDVISWCFLKTNFKKLISYFYLQK